MKSNNGAAYSKILPPPDLMWLQTFFKRRYRTRRVLYLNNTGENLLRNRIKFSFTNYSRFPINFPNQLVNENYSYPIPITHRPNTPQTAYCKKFV